MSSGKVLALGLPPVSSPCLSCASCPRSRPFPKGGSYVLTSGRGTCAFLIQSALDLRYRVPPRLYRTRVKISITISRK
jgi:hypothetical protein